MAEFDPIAFNLENVDRHLLDYLPPVLQRVQEFQAINAASEPEIKAAWQSLGRVLGNQFLAEADGQGLSVWERELGIFCQGYGHAGAAPGADKGSLAAAAALYSALAAELAG